MKSFVFVFIGGGLLQLVFPWWIGLVPALVAGFVWSQRSAGAFGAGFAGLGLQWLLPAAYMDWRNGGILSTRMAEMLHLPAPDILLVLGALIGGLLGGLACWGGFSIKASLLDPEELAGQGWG